jgi:hypothetical protein
MVFYPEPSGTRLAVAFAVSVPAAVAGAGTVHYLLRGVRARGRWARFLARWWSFALGIGLLIGVAVAIAGPYAFAVRRRPPPPSSAGCSTPRSYRAAATTWTGWTRTGSGRRPVGPGVEQPG